MTHPQRPARPQRRRTPWLRPLALAMLASGLASPASALDYVWLSGTGNWSDANRWSLLGVPGASDSATINNGNHEVVLTDTRSVGALFLSNGYLGGSGTLNTGSASFINAVLGRDDSTEGTLNVSGVTSFAGSGTVVLRYGQVLNLNGNTTWSAGNGRIDLGQGFAGNASTDPYRGTQLNIAAGTTFTDAGAAAAGGTKEIGYNGGQVNNAGTYVRNGLGTTLGSYGFHNTGTVQINAGSFGLTGGSERSSSSGQINVAAGATLLLGSADISGGAINNSGRVLLSSNALTDVAAAASISGAWEMSNGNAELRLQGTQNISSLSISNGYLGGSATLNTGSASFISAVLGRDDSTEGTLNVSGNTSFAGSGTVVLRYGQVLNLNGNATWSAGNGRIDLGQGFAGNASTDPYRGTQLNVAAGTTFTDAGAAAAGGTKEIGYNGGQVNNAGTYVRNGLGTTLGSYGFHNTGTVQINAGSFGLTGGSERSSSSGQINVAAGATLLLGSADISGGAINNSGRVLLSSHAVTDVAAAASISGAWEMSNGNAELRLQGTQNISSLSISNGYLGGSATLNTGSASFISAVLGRDDSTEGTLNVSGNTSFAGSGTVVLRYGQVLNLNGNATWSAGNGRIDLGQGFAGNASTDPYRGTQLNVAAGTTFTDAGAAAAGGTKEIGYNGGQVNNAGTYVRNGLGTTLGSYGFHNTGTVQINAGSFGLTGGSERSSSSGQINVAAGATLLLGSADISGGAINNSGRVLLSSNALTDVAAAATINGAWEMSNGNAELRLQGTQNISSLSISNGYLGGSATLNTGSASFISAVLGRDDSTEGTLNVSGNTSFAGSGTVVLRYGQVLNLNGNATWSAGNGRIDLGQGFAGNASTDPYRGTQLNVAAGTTFTDAGAAAAGGTKEIGYNGGQINNTGTYVRNGLGTTLGSYGFYNTGTLQINAGRFAVDDAFRNNGLVTVASGAVFKGTGYAFTNHGNLQGTGTVETRSATEALRNLGTINPGDNGTGGTLAVTGDLQLDAAGTLHIDLVALGQNDRVAISDDLSVSGTLAVWAAGYSLNVGDSFVIASFDQLAAGSAFSSITWNGLAGDAFSVKYNAHDITLRVTAVPEPQTWLLLLGGLLVLGNRQVRRALSA